MSKWFVLISGVLWVCGMMPAPAGALAAAEMEFVRGINLNGPAVRIDGRLWEPGDTPHLESRDRAFENPTVPLIPPTDDDRALMLRSSRWNTRAELRLTHLQPGPHALFVYVWEDNHSETFTLLLDGREVAVNVVSGPAGTWQKLGPFHTTVQKDSLVLTTRGGAANLSGLELWRGDGPFPVMPSGQTLPPRDSAVVKRFDEQIAPLFLRHCAECHGATSGEGAFSIVSETAAMAGGDSGPAIIPGRPAESPLLDYIRSGEMPKNRPPMSPREVALIERWIADGAKWGTPTLDPFTVSTDRRAGYDWWSLQPVVDVAPPRVEHSLWIEKSVDRYILAKLEAMGLAPSPEADRRTLIRRVTFDLIGLPPSPAEVIEFLNDERPEAYAELVDRLLASPHYGERWGRHWLDVVRFGESQGFERNRIRNNAWRYRDWVIQAFNRNLPYDEFLRQQIAGDVLLPDDLDALIATGYHVCGTWDQVAHHEGSAAMRNSARLDHLEDLVGTLGQSILGLTLNCARCHDHKFDPISQREYYQFVSLLSGVNQEKEERSQIPFAATPLQPGFEGTAHVIIPRQPYPTFLLERGDSRKPKSVVSPAGLKAFRALPADLGLGSDAPEAERRKALAFWLTDARNPLTARVFVNRVWYHHFGQGLVATPSDFGFSGGRPSHPELLDHLAATFVSSGWDIKDLHRRLVNSATYKQQSQMKNMEAAALDTENRLLWRANSRRLDGESLRDAMLSVSGALNLLVGGPSYRDVAIKETANHEFGEPTNEFSDVTNRRTIYRLWARSGNHPMLDALDCPDPSVMSPRRAQTITPLQALSMINGPFVEFCAQRLADRVTASAGEDVDARVRAAFQATIVRDPTPRELERARHFVQAEGLAQLAIVLLNTNEFLFLD